VLHGRGRLQSIEHLRQLSLEQLKFGNLPLNGV